MKGVTRLSADGGNRGEEQAADTLQSASETGRLEEKVSTERKGKRCRPQIIHEQSRKPAHKGRHPSPGRHDG